MDKSKKLWIKKGRTIGRLFALIFSTRGNHATRLFDRGQEIVKLLPPMAVAKTDNLATHSNHTAVVVP